jgi:endonuclease YncB( thermonuclease family)
MCLLWLAACDVSADQIKVVDGDSLVVDGQMTRLVGIDSPEYTQKCKTAEGKKYACGLEAKAFMEDLIAQGFERGDTINCEVQGKDKYKRDLAVCFMGEVNLNEQMVANGHAVAYMHPWYESAQARAKEQKLGIWQGKFMRPEFYRILQKHRKQKQKSKNNRNSY